MKKRGLNLKKAQLSADKSVVNTQRDADEIKMWQYENDIDTCKMTRKIMNQD